MKNPRFTNTPVMAMGHDEHSQSARKLALNTQEIKNTTVGDSASLMGGRIAMFENSQKWLDSKTINYSNSGGQSPEIPDQIELVTVPVNGLVFYDANQNYTFDAGEEVAAGDRFSGAAIGGVDSLSGQLFYKAPVDTVGAGLDRFQVRTYDEFEETDSATVFVDVIEKPLFSLNGDGQGIDAKMISHLDHMPGTLVAGLAFNDSAAVTGFDLTLIHGFKPGDDLRLEGIEHGDVFNGVKVNYHFWEEKVQRIFLSSQDGGPVDHETWKTLLDKLRLVNEEGALYNGERVVQFDPYYEDSQPGNTKDNPLLWLTVEGSVNLEPYRWVQRVGEADVSWTSSGARVATSPDYEALPQVTVNIAPLTVTQLDAASDVVEGRAAFQFYEYPSQVKVMLPVGLGVQANSVPIAVSVPRLVDEELQRLIDPLVTDRPQDDGSHLLSQLNSHYPGAAELMLHSIQLEADATLIESEGRVTVDGAFEKSIMLVDIAEVPAGVELELSRVGVAAVIGEGTINVSGSNGYVYAQAGGQTFTAQGSNNMLHGGAGDDQFIGTLHGNTLHGGLGHDLVTYSGQLADYQVTWGMGAVQIEAVSGSVDMSYDRLINVEEIQFSDQTINMAGHSSPLQAAITTLYGQILERQPELGGYAYWSEATEERRIGTMALDFLQSAEYQIRKGVAFNQLDTAAKVAELYTSILGREADADGQIYWEEKLAGGNTLEQIADGFIFSSELTGQYQTLENWDFIL